MRFNLLTLLSLTFLLVSLSFADSKTDDEKPSNNLCLEFSTPIIKPQVSKDFSVVKPDKKIDYKLIIVNPCQSLEKKSSNSRNPGLPQNYNFINPLLSYENLLVDLKVQNENLKTKQP